jgi:hypothetical protein
LSVQEEAMTGPLFLRYAEARIAFDADPSPRREATMFAAFIDWVRDYAPDCAERAIALFRARLDADAAQRRRG